MTFRFPLALSPYEVEARCLFNKALERRETPIRVAILKVFLHHWEGAIPITEVECVLPLVAPEYEFQYPIIQECLSGLVREGVLRSRHLEGRMLYEVNYG